ncbi:MAG TPA: outer membrane protein transport protein [Thermoanaerobaculia bacterium]|nr:outer membrane protein transport protein [Thermoanaerobaculia bacterium]
MHRLSVCLALAGLCGSLPLKAQTNLETNAGVQFNFSTPGAGNLGLGGAFLGLAFDASAAYTNPAGLTLVVKPEALLETRHWRYTHVFTDRGRITDAAPTGEPPDTISGLRDAKAEDQVTGLSFLSYVYPRRNWSFALYRHELVNFEANFSTFGAYLERTRGRNPLGIPGTLDGRLAALRNRMQVDVVAYGGAAAYRLGGGFSLGVAVSSFDFSIDSTADRFLPDLFAAPDFNRDLLVNFQTQQGDDRDLGVNAGFLWESPEKTWSVGGVYRQGPDFTFRAQSRQGRGALVPLHEADQPAFFHVPDVYGLGLGFRPSDALRLAFDYDRVRYSRLTEGFVDIFDLAVLSPGQPQELDKFQIDDANELHLGLEYAFLQHWPVFTLRAGAWYDPDHSLRFEGKNVGFRAVFRPRGDQMHYTAGVGVALRRLQVDAAVDHSDRVSVIALSAGFRI